MPDDPCDTRDTRDTQEDREAREARKHREHREGRAGCEHLAERTAEEEGRYDRDHGNDQVARDDQEAREAREAREAWDGRDDHRPRERTWCPPDPYDLPRTLSVLGRGPYDPAFRAEHGGVVWRATRTPQGAATLRVVPGHGPGSRVRATAWGPGAEWALDALPGMLGAADDPSAFTPRHAVVAEALRRHRGLRLVRTGLVLESLIPSILEQRVTTLEAYRAWRLLLRRFGEPAPGPVGVVPPMHVMPEPHVFARIPSWEWHRAGVDSQRSSAVLRAVRLARRLEEATAMELPDAMARLRAVPGIGPWTAAETLQRSNGAPDAITVGDLHLPGIVGYALTGARGADDARMLELLAPYAGQRYRAARLILLSGRSPKRRAPRAPIMDIARL